MKPKPFILRYEIEGIPFALQFLAADDFNIIALKEICRNFEIPSSGRKIDLISRIERYLDQDGLNLGWSVILQSLIKKSKKWFAVKIGEVNEYPNLENPEELIYSEGRPEWYGPVIDSDNENVYWYIRPHFPVHWELDGDPLSLVQRQIRWLAFARVTNGYVSIHWQGFTVALQQEMVEHENQFPYWNFIPDCFSELSEILNIQLLDPNLHDLILHNLWDEYRLDDSYSWTDLRIRAESGGVSLNARSSGVDYDIDIRGINHLARTLRNSISQELNQENIDLPNVNRLDEVILRTLIREFGAKSYEFSLEHEQEKIFKGHVYFGMKPNFPGPDSFPHINCYSSWGYYQNQLEFILDELST